MKAHPLNANICNGNIGFTVIINITIGILLLKVLYFYSNYYVK